MIENMICPILRSDGNSPISRCVMDRCAWWDQLSNNCSIKTIADKLKETEKK